MRVNKVRMTKDDRNLIIQGMVHVAPKSFYEQIQKEMNEGKEAGYTFFFEGIRTRVPEVSLTKNQTKIKEVLNLTFSLYSSFARVLGVTTQREKISYPENAIHADIEFNTLIRRLDSAGFRPGLFHWLLTWMNSEEGREKFSSADLEPKNKSWLSRLFKFLSSPFVFLLKYWFFGSSRKVILDERNIVCVEKVRELKHGNVFIHYGNKHVEGIVKLLEQDNWKVTEETFVEVDC